MADPESVSLVVGEGGAPRRIAALWRRGAGAPVVWLGGFRSDMAGTKAEALAKWAHERDRSFLRFDYFGHGESSGDFENSTRKFWKSCTARRPEIIALNVSLNPS